MTSFISVKQLKDCTTCFCWLYFVPCKHKICWRGANLSALIPHVDKLLDEKNKTTKNRRCKLWPYGSQISPRLMIRHIRESWTPFYHAICERSSTQAAGADILFCCFRLDNSTAFRAVCLLSLAGPFACTRRCWRRTFFAVRQNGEERVQAGKKMDICTY